MSSLGNHERDTTPAGEATLSDADAAVLDAILEARARGASAGPLPPGSAERAERVGQVLTLLDAADVDEAPADLTERTMEAVVAARQRQRFARQVEMLAEPRRSIGVSWRRAAAVAAVFLIAFSLVAPVLDQNKKHGQQLADRAALMTAGSAFQRYAVDHDGMMPRGQTSAGTPWNAVGSPNVQPIGPIRSNSAHLYILVRDRYLTADQLASPTNPHTPAPGVMTPQHRDWLSPQAVPYSYQNQSTAAPIPLRANPRLAILANKNPLFVVDDHGRVVFNPSAQLDRASLAHGGRGQNVLFADGSVTWTVSPVMKDGDNLWVITGVRHYQGTEAPDEAHRTEESHLVP